MIASDKELLFFLYFAYKLTHFWKVDHAPKQNKEIDFGVDSKFFGVFGTIIQLGFFAIIG